MLQTANLHYNSPVQNTSGLAHLHPGPPNINGRIISKSPTQIHIQELRNLSPNKLNATRKPMVGINSNANNLVGNFTSRHKNSPSPNNKPGYRDYSNNYQNFSTNPNNFNSSRVPLINSKGYSPRVQQFFSNLTQRNAYCENHVNKQAQFYLESDSGDIGYCQKCAINLASKGFTVKKKQGKGSQTHRQNQTIFEKHKLQPFYIPECVGIPGYAQIEKFVNQIDSIHSSYINQMHKYQTIDMHYNHQYQITENFYDELLDLVEQMKREHLGDIQNQSKKHSQLALIKQDLLKLELEEIQIIRKDLIEHVDTILDEFDKPVIQQSFNLYRQQIFRFKDKIDDQDADFSKQIINEKESDLKLRINKILQYMQNVWKEKKVEAQPILNKIQPSKAGEKIVVNNQDTNRQNQQKPKTVKQIINMNTKLQAQYNKQKQTTAYRKLFQDDNDQFQIEENRKEIRQEDFFNEEEKDKEVYGQRSPQFKNI